VVGRFLSADRTERGRVFVVSSLHEPVALRTGEAYCTPHAEVNRLNIARDEPAL